MAPLPLLIPLGMEFAQPCYARLPADAIALEDQVNACVGYFDVVIARARYQTNRIDPR